MIQFNPDSRISTSDALQHPFFNTIKEQGHVTAFKSQQLLVQQQSKNRVSRAGSNAGESTPTLMPIPMDADIEKIGEEEEFLKYNVSITFQYLCINKSVDK